MLIFLLRGLILEIWVIHWTQRTFLDKSLISSWMLCCNWKISARMKDVSSELTTFLSHFSDRSKLLRNQKSALLSLEKTIIPFITKVASEIHSTSTDLAPVGGANYIHSLEEKKSKKVSSSNTKRKWKIFRSRNLVFYSSSENSESFGYDFWQALISVIPVRYLTLDENLKQRQKVTQKSY